MKGTEALTCSTTTITVSVIPAEVANASSDKTMSKWLANVVHVHFNHYTKQYLVVSLGKGIGLEIGLRFPHGGKKNYHHF